MIKTNLHHTNKSVSSQNPGKSVIQTKEGYKQTEVGMIPEDWNLISYGDAFEFLSTATYSRKQLAENGDIGYVHYGDIHVKWNHFLDLSKSSLPFISEDKLKRYSLIKNGDLIMADASEDYEGVGASVEVLNIADKKVISGLHTFLLRDNQGIFSPKFKGYLHTNEIIKSQLDRLATGLKVYGVSKTNLKLILIPLPPSLAEQTAIATALSDTDTLIEAQEQLIAKKRLIKQGAMQELLTGKRRLVETESTGFKQTEVGLIPEDWKVKNLGGLLKIKHGKSQKKVVDPNGAYPILASGGQIGKASKYIYDKASVLIGRKGTIDVPQYVDKPFWTVDTLFYSEIEEKNNPKFIYYNFNLIDWYSYNEASGVPSLNAKTIEKIPISVPPTLTEQTAIATALFDMDTEIDQLEVQLDKYRLVKQGMMQELLTGKTRLLSWGKNSE